MIFRLIAYFWICLLLLFACSSLDVRAQENAYDLLSKSLTPLLNPFLENPNPEQPAYRIIGIVEVKHEQKLMRERIVISLEAPDKLRIDTMIDGQHVTICRNGETVWGVPDNLIKPLLPSVSNQSPDRHFGIFHLPVNDTAVALLPALLQIEDHGLRQISTGSARVLDLALIPELAKKTHTENIRVRAWFDPESAKPQRFETVYKGQRSAINFESVEYSRSLPVSTWVPNDSERLKTVTLSSSEFLSLMETLITRVKRGS